jgi:hypothetical protein
MSSLQAFSTDEGAGLFNGSAVVGLTAATLVCSFRFEPAFTSIVFAEVGMDFVGRGATG